MQNQFWNSNDPAVDSEQTENPNRRDISQTEAFFLAAQNFRQRTTGSDSPNAPIRRYPRQLRSISVSIEPLDDDFQPCEDLFWVVSRDISLKGIGIISHEAIEHDYVRIGLVDESITTIGQIRHNTSIGQRYPLYLVGIEFLHKLRIKG